MIKNRSRYYLPVILILATIMVFWKIGTHDLHEWDESRNGQNAYEMYFNGDYINLYYCNIPDTWNAKPPLMIWCILVCYKLFGFNEFALRLPAALSIIAFFFYFYRLVRQFHNELHAFLACTILLSCKAVIGWHVGTNGDFDAMLLCFLTASAYHFMRFASFGTVKDAYLTALFTGLAFYTKGPAGCLYLPGFLLYLLVKPNGTSLLRNRHLWFSLFLFLLIAGSWIGLVLTYGVRTEQSHYGTSNSLETLFIYDTFKRFTEPVFDRELSKQGFDFLFPAFDSRINLWNYLFYICLITGIILTWKNRGRWRDYIRQCTASLFLFACCHILVLLLVFFFATNPRDWYLSPLFIFIAYVTAVGTVYLAGLWRPVQYIFYALLAFTLVRHFVYLHSQPNTLHYLFSNNKTDIEKPYPIVILSNPEQHLWLYFSFYGKEYIRLDDISQMCNYKDHILIYKPGSQAQFPVPTTRIDTNDSYLMDRIN